MADYLLVHGGDRDGSLWDGVAPLLRKQGHQVFCPSMTSVKQASLQQNIDEVIAYISSNKLENIILVGHSYGGLVITGVTDQLSDKIASLVYVDSTIPQDGKSLYDLILESGFDIKAYGLTLDLAVMSKLNFDQQKVFSRPKSYVYCLQSEFIDVTRPMYQTIKKSNGDWLLFALDAKHACMFTHPRELAVILSGVFNITLKG